MKKILPRVLAAGALAASVLVGAHPASAALPAPYMIGGGCSLNTANDATGQVNSDPNVFTGQISDRSVVVSTDPADNPVTASVTCQVYVNGVPQPGAKVVTKWTSVAQAGVAVATYSAGPIDVVTVCRTVNYLGADGDTGSDLTCSGMVSEPPPPPPQYDIINEVLDQINTVFNTVVDPTICPILKTLSPGVGPVTIDPDGDVWDGSPIGEVYTCPPYTDADGAF